MALTHELKLENNIVTGKLATRIIQYKDGKIVNDAYCYTMEELVMAVWVIQQEEEAANGTERRANEESK